MEGGMNVPDEATARRPLWGRLEPLGRAEAQSETPASEPISLTIRAPAGEAAGGARLTFSPACRDWRGMAALVFWARSASPGRVRFTLEHAGGRWHWYWVPKPGLTLRVVVLIRDLLERPPNTSYPGYFTFGGGPDPLDAADVRCLSLQYDQPGPAVDLEIRELHLTAVPAAPAVLRPPVVIDRFGQWIGLGARARSEAEIRRAWAEEPTEEISFAGRSRYGGDLREQLSPSGYFRVERAGTRWRLVDPEGHPFFSIGATCVRSHMPGPVGGREALFEALPPLSSTARGRRPTSGDPPAAEADFYRWNLMRRYGDEWRPRWSQQQIVRLRRWGFNTIANWSDEQLCALGRVPYTDRLRGLDRLCQALPDVFDPRFGAQVRAAVEPQLVERLGDRMLIGYFVGNEPRWMFPGALSPFVMVFRSADHPHTRAEAIRWLQGRYRDVAALNTAWGTQYRDWDELASTGVPDPRRGPEPLREDAVAFTGHVLAHFYAVICQAVRAVDPHHLLLGARFYSASLPDPYIAACRPFDVFSFNCYRPAVPAEAVDRVLALAGIPSLIGEFHFGEVGNGRSGALISVRSQAERGEAYQRYVLSSAAHAGVVGLHWFQWLDEPVSGRFDGEEYNCGLIDMQDIPYAEMIGWVEATHKRLYPTAFG
ncbi:MAG TPA: hypothetical protein VF234_05430 [Limnochordia bacterium]